MQRNDSFWHWRRIPVSRPSALSNRQLSRKQSQCINPAPSARMRLAEQAFEHRQPLGRICLDKGRGFQRKVRAGATSVGRPALIRTIRRGSDRVDIINMAAKMVYD